MIEYSKPRKYVIKMKLFLCGGGSGSNIITALNKFVKVIDKTKPILYIPLAMDNIKYDSCYNWFKTELKLINLNNFEMIKSSKELSAKNLNNYSAIFIGGGNTYKLLYELKQNNNYQKIKEYLTNDGIVFGSSAGAIIFGKNIDSCLLDDKNDINLKDTSSFNLLNNYSLLCHLQKQTFINNLEYLKKYSIHNNLIYLPENNIIFIDNRKISILGNQNYVIFKNGQYMVRSFENFEEDIYNQTNNIKEGSELL